MHSWTYVLFGNVNVILKITGNLYLYASANDNLSCPMSLEAHVWLRSRRYIHRFKVFRQPITSSIAFIAYTCITYLLTLFIFTTMVILLIYVYPNPPCQLSLWEETGAPGEKTHDFRQIVERLFSYESAERIEPTVSEVKSVCSVDCATKAPSGII
jgi:hypothetical protein